MKPRVALAASALLALFSVPAGAFDQASLDRVMVRPYVCEECDLTKLTLAPGANFGGTQISRANFSGSVLFEASFQRATMLNTNFSGASLRSANIMYATMNGANFSKADLTGASFAGSIMRNVDLGGAILTDADLSGVNLTGANLKGATGATLDAASSLCNATLPDGTVSKTGCR